MKLLINLCAFVVGTLVWYLADPLGLLWAFLLSSLGTILGIYIGWRIARHLGL